MNKKKNNNIDVQRIIKEIKDHLNNGTEMTYVKSLIINENYKQKEINKVIKQIKRRKIKNFIKKLFIG